MTPVLTIFRPAFSTPTYQRFLVLVLATVLTTGRWTITNLLRTIRSQALGQANLNASGTTAAIIAEMQNAFALNIDKLVGCHAAVARQLDELASIEGLKGVMCIFDDFVAGTEDFGRHVMPLVRSR
jgi:alkanesulfonate monooxygenase SsuD/methylene tetrahydromethanopterin reductase-like flavin-dependent oxidoreductase (luciferase family)